jgi:hypothetical protein
MIAESPTPGFIDQTHRGLHTELPFKREIPEQRQNILMMVQ